jgi:hypothetical protein
MFGVWMIGLPAQPIVSHRWSSVNKKTMFGGPLGAVLSLIPLLQPASEKAAAAEPPATKLRN